MIDRISANLAADVTDALVGSHHVFTMPLMASGSTYSRIVHGPPTTVNLISLTLTVVSDTDPRIAA